MRDLVLFPDAAATVASHLRDSLSVDTADEVPNPRPAEFYVVRRVGGTSRTVVIDDATVIVEAWGPSNEEAEDLAQLARAHLLALAGDVVDGVTVFRVREVGGPARLPDPLSGQARVTTTYQVSVRGSSMSSAS